MNNISLKAKMGKNIILGNNVVIGDHVDIADNVYIGNNSTIDNVNIKSGTRIEDNCIIGYSHATGWVSRATPQEELKFERLEIGENVLIRDGCTIYIGSHLGNNVKIHHKVLIREKTKIGENTSIGSMCDLEGNLTIGANCSIHSNCHLCYDTTIGDYVFIAPFCVTTNGNPMSYKRPQLYEKFGYEKGPIIESGCQIAVHVTILPRVKVGYESLVGANTVVTKNVEPLSIIIGVPGVKKGVVDEFYRLPLPIRKELGLE